MTHASVPEDVRMELGISDTLVRLSVGLEDEEDIIADLHQALTAAVSVYTHPHASCIYQALMLAHKHGPLAGLLPR